MVEQRRSLTPIQRAILRALQENAPGGTRLPQVLNYLYAVSDFSAGQLLHEIGPMLVLMYEQDLISLHHASLRWGSGDIPILPLFTATYDQGVIWDSERNQWAVPEVEEKSSWQIAPRYSLADVDELVSKGYAALEAGLRDKAEICWLTALPLDPNNEQAWLGLANISPSIHARDVFLQRVREINPNNLTVQQSDFEAKE